MGPGLENTSIREGLSPVKQALPPCLDWCPGKPDDYFPETMPSHQLSVL